MAQPTVPVPPPSLSSPGAAQAPMPAAGAVAGSLPGMRSEPPRRWQSAQLFDGDNEVVIEHGGSLYRLRITSLGKLILTK